MNTDENINSHENTDASNTPHNNIENNNQRYLDVFKREIEKLNAPRLGVMEGFDIKILHQNDSFRNAIDIKNADVCQLIKDYSFTDAKYIFTQSTMN